MRFHSRWFQECSETNGTGGIHRVVCSLYIDLFKSNIKMRVCGGVSTKAMSDKV
jgi:hypothetical protein